MGLRRQTATHAALDDDDGDKDDDHENNANDDNYFPHAATSWRGSGGEHGSVGTSTRPSAQGQTSMNAQKLMRTWFTLQLWQHC